MSERKLKVPTFSGHPIHNRIKYQGIPISVENERGTPREGNGWITHMRFAYGYIRGTKGVDGDHVDVFVGPHPDSRAVWIVDQLDPKTGEFDEQKCMLGFESEDEAKQAYLQHYDSPEFLGRIHRMDIETFKRVVFNRRNAGKRIPTEDRLFRNKAAKYLSGTLKERGSMKSLQFKSNPRYEDGTLMKDGGKWYVFSKGKPKPIKLSKRCTQALEKSSRELLKRAEPKRYYSPEEIKARGMRWVTIRGARVLLQGTEDGWVVVGGADGNLNHFKVDQIEEKEAYEQRRKERAEEAKRQREKAEAGMSREEIQQIREEDKRRKQARQKAREAAKNEYKSRVEQTVGAKIEDMLTEDDLKTFANKARAKVTGERKAAEERADTQPKETEESKKKTEKKIQEEIEISKKAAVKNKLKDLEHAANNLLADYYEGRDDNPTAVLTVGEQELVLDVDKAQAILGSKNGLKQALKSAKEQFKDVAPNVEDEAFKVGEVFAGADDFTEEEIRSQIERNIETAKNIQFYDEINAHHDRVAKHIENGAARALNGVMSDIYEGGAHFNEKLVRTLGIEAISRAIAHKLEKDGKAKVAAKALKEYSDRVREKTVDEAMQQAEHAYTEKDKIHANAKGENAIYTKAQANAFSIRWYTHAYNNLGNAAGSLRAMAHTIAALDDPPSDIIRKHMGRDRVAIARKLDDAGLSPDQYSLKKDKETGQYMVEIPSDSITPFFEKTEEQRKVDSRKDAIKMHRANTGKLAAGVKEGNKWGFDPKSGKVDPKLAASQEAGYRFAMETDKSLLSFQAGIGKTFIGANVIGDMMRNQGAKKILVAVPAGMRDESSAEYRKFLDSDIAEKVHTAGQRMGREERRALYEQEGIHVVSHDAIRNDKDAIHSQEWDMVIADEVHDMINAKDTEFGAKNFESLSELSEKTSKVMAMTGTPIKTDKREMWKTARLTGNTAALGRMKDFEARHKDINQSTSAFAASESETFRREIAPFTYAQEYSISAKKDVTRVDAKMTPEQRKETKRVMEEYSRQKELGAKGASGRRDIELWKISNLHGGRNNPKFKQLEQEARQHIEANPSNKGLVFLSQGASKSGAEQYATQLEQSFGKGSAAAITGSTSAARMRRLKERYKDPNDPLKFLVGNEALSTGHNLQAGSKVWKIDTPVSKAQDDQQNARVHRNGQDKDVQITYLDSDNPNDINKRYLFEKKGRESEIMGNPNHVDGRDGTGFGSIVRHFERDMRGV